MELYLGRQDGQAPESCTENGVKIEIQRNRRRHFVDRPNRFIAHVEVNGAVETVHVKNTGRCKELLLPGTAVRLEVSDNPKRKTKIRPCDGTQAGPWLGQYGQSST